MISLLDYLRGRLAPLGAVVLLAFAILMFGYVIGLKAFWLRAVIAGSIILIALIVMAVKARRRAQSDSALEKGFRGLTPGHREAAADQVALDVEDIDKKMSDALVFLRRARGRRFGKSVLYSLPVYMIIGPPGGGKSVLISKVGLSRPPGSPDQPNVPGFGTRSCDLWISDEGLFFDTAGRATLQEYEAVDRPFWLELLRLLRRWRSRQPINGLIVAIPAAGQDGLIELSPDQCSELAKTVRERIDEVIGSLGIDCPIYLVFTKCDLLSGFVEMFEDLRADRRQQILGATFKYFERPTVTERNRFEEEYQRLVSTLSMRRLTRLQIMDPDPLRTRRTFLMPEELREAGKVFAEFVSEMMRPYRLARQQPRLRGFYLTSGTQVGSPTEILVGQVIEKLGLTSLPSTPEKTTEPKAFFIEDLFRKLIFPDQYLAGPSTKRARFVAWGHAWGIAAAFAVVLLGVVGIVSSYYGNRAYLKDLDDVTAATTGAVRNAARPEDAVSRLTPLYQSLTEMEKGDRKGLTWWNGWILYSGDRVEDAMRQAYLDLMCKSVLTPLLSTLQGKLGWNAVLSQEQRIETLLAVLYLTQEPDRQSPSMADDLAGHIIGAGHSYQGSDTLLTLVAEQLRYYIGKKGQWPVSDAGESVQRSLGWLREIGEEEYLYALMLRQAGGLDSSLRVSQILGEASAIVQEASIPWAFTRSGWTAGGEAFLATLPDFVKNDLLCVRAWQPREDGLDIQRRLRQRYFTECHTRWASFVGQWNLRPWPDLKEACSGLILLSDSDGPSARLILAAVREIPRDSSATDTWLRGFAGADADTTVADPLRGYLKILSDVAQKTGSWPTEVAQWDISNCAQGAGTMLAEVEKFRADAQRCCHLRDGRSPETEWEAFLLAPLEEVKSIARQTTISTINSLWSTKCYTPATKFLDQFPFNLNTVVDASSVGVVKFFRDDGPFDQFNQLVTQLPASIRVSSSNYDNLRDAASEIQRITETDQVKVDLQLKIEKVDLPSDVSELSFVLNANRTYRMEGAGDTWDFSWKPENASSLNVRSTSGRQFSISPAGDWGLWKLFKEASRDTGSKICWRLDGAPTVCVHLSSRDARLLLDGGPFARFKNACRQRIF